MSCLRYLCLFAYSGVQHILVLSNTYYNSECTVSVVCKPINVLASSAIDRRFEPKNYEEGI